MEIRRTTDDQTSHSVRRENNKGIGNLEEDADAEAKHTLALSNNVIKQKQQDFLKSTLLPFRFFSTRAITPHHVRGT